MSSTSALKSAGSAAVRFCRRYGAIDTTAPAEVELCSCVVGVSRLHHEDGR